MIAIDTIVSIKSGDEYGGKYTGKLGIVKRFTDDRVGVEFAGLKNHASKYGLFWFNKENVTPSLFDTPKRNDGIIPAALAKAFLNFTFGAPRVSLGVKRKAISSEATEENEKLKAENQRLREQFHNLNNDYAADMKYLIADCEALSNRCFALTKGVTCVFCELNSFKCKHAMNFDQKVKAAKNMMKEINNAED